jgi:hypothetical protein
MPASSSSTPASWRERLSPPPPDSREGAVLAVASVFALVYILVFVAQYDTMTSFGFAFDITALSLLIGLISAFALSTMLGSDVSTYQRLELELARTVLAYVGSGTPPPSDAPLAGVWRAHVAAAEESRRMARAHAYGLGLFTLAGILSLGATLLVALGGVTVTQDVVGLGMFVEWFAFTFLAAGAGVVSVAVGYASPISVYDVFSPRRWRRNAGRQQAVEGAVSEIAWLSEFSRSARDSRISPAGRSMLPSWQE